MTTIMIRDNAEKKMDRKHLILDVKVTFHFVAVSCFEIVCNY